MADARALRDEPADGLVRTRRSACRRGDDDARPVSVGRPARVTVYHAADCGLCARALEVVEAARAELAFDLETVDIGGDAELEERYRSSIPVVEIDGERVFAYFVDAAALRDRLAARA